MSGLLAIVTSTVYQTDLGLNKEELTRAGFEPTTSAITCRCSLNWAISPYVGGLPILSLSFFKVPVRSRATINCFVTRDHT